MSMCGALATSQPPRPRATWWRWRIGEVDGRRWNRNESERTGIQGLGASSFARAKEHSRRSMDMSRCPMRVEDFPLTVVRAVAPSCCCCHSRSRCWSCVTSRSLLETPSNPLINPQETERCLQTTPRSERASWSSALPFSFSAVSFSSTPPCSPWETSCSLSD